MDVVRVVNNRATFLTMPGVVVKNERGLDVTIEPKLQPGGNNVDARVVAAVEALDPSKGAGKVWSQWKAMNWVKILSAKESKIETKKPEGPEPPSNLSEYRSDSAELLVKNESNPKILARWSKNEKRKSVADAIQARLTALSSEEE